MQNALVLVRDNISDAITTAVRNMIVDGRLPDGKRINEVQLSQELGVSRTPLREALARLAQDGTLKSTPRIGYFVSALSFDDFKQIYAIRPLLDPEALRLAGLPSRDRLKALQQINEKMVKAGDAHTIIALDDQFHLELIAECPNLVLLDLIKQFIQRTRRYEIALMREQENVSVAGGTHKSIVAALSRRNIEAACAALRTNLQMGYDPIASWLNNRESKRKS